MAARRPNARRGNVKPSTAAAVDAAGLQGVPAEHAAGNGHGPPAVKPITTSAQAAHRTVSVSPHRVSEESRITTMPTTDIVLTPRVLDQRAFEELSDTLQQLIGQSQELATELSRQIEAASTLDTQATRASTRLQDRLHLSARMLKALQVQMDKLQSVQDEFSQRSHEAEKAHAQQIQALDAHRAALAGQLDGLALKISDALRSREKECGSAMEDAVAANLRRCATTEQQLVELSDTVAKLTDLVVQSEKSITAVAHRAAQSAQRSEHVVEDAKRTLRQCEEARQHLGKDLIDAEERLCESARRADELTAKVQTAVARCESAERQFSRIADAAGPFIEQLERLEQAVTDSNALLPMLEPWEAILLKSRTEPESLPAPLRELIDLVRAGLRGEMRQLAGSMRGLAERMETMSAHGVATGHAGGARTTDQLEEVPADDRALEIVTLPGVALAALGGRKSPESVESASTAATANC